MNSLLKRIKRSIGMYYHYMLKPNPEKFGFFGDGAMFSVPADLKKQENIYLYDHARIGPNSCIMSVGSSKFIMKSYSGASSGLTVVTSNHRQSVGVFRDGRSNADNDYKDIVVEEDVWIGVNVTLLQGSHIGRGAIIGAGAVVNKDIPPYSIACGVPAKVVGFKFTLEEAYSHEQQLYPEDSRIPISELKKIYDEYADKIKK